jgi:hypothetical protein
MNTYYDDDGKVIERRVVCSACGAEAPGAKGIREAKLAAESDDWESDGGQGYECPSCAAA